MFEHPKFRVVIEFLYELLVLQDQFRKQVGFLRQLLSVIAQVAVSNCGQGSRTRSFYTLSGTVSG